MMFEQRLEALEVRVAELESQVATKTAKRFKPPAVGEVAAYCRERKNGIDPETFVEFYASKGWLIGKSPMKDWRASVRTWEKNGHGNGCCNGHRKDPRGNMATANEILSRLIDEDSEPF